MSDVMVGRARIAVSPQDTIDAVLERVRASEADELVIDVDERSPLLISLQHLHSLEEAAQEQGIQVTIASTNSKLLNAARVFGLDVIDNRANPATPRAVVTGRLLAGAPLADQEEDEPEPVAPRPARAQAPPPIITLQPVATRPAPPEVAEEAEEAAEEIESRPAPRRPQAARAPQPAAPVHLDPYGQPYTDEVPDEEEEAPPPRGGGRTIRRATIRPNPPAQAATVQDEEGWDELPGERGQDDEYYADEPQRPGLLAGLTAFWADVRAWVDARRGRSGDLDEEYAEVDEFAEATADEGWDEPPYQARQAAVTAPLKPAVAPAAPVADADDAEETPAPARTIRPLPVTNDVPRREEREAGRPRPVSVVYEDVADDDEDGDWDEEREAWARPRRAAMGSLAFAAVAIVLVALAILYLLVPTATVTLVAKTGAVSTDFKVVVGEIDPNSPQGQPTQERIVVPAKRITVPLTASVTKQATGARLEPDVTAGGSVVLANGSTSSVTVAKGTVLAATDGRGYVTTEGVTVGAADYFGTGTVGTATVKVAAEIKGSGGNAPIGAVRGQLPSGIQYNNAVAPIAGGSDKRITTIAKQDLSAAQAAAEEQVRGKGQGAINGALPPNSVIMHDTAGVGNYAVTFNTKEGTDGDSVTATVTAEATALTYVQGDVETRARAEVERRLAAAAKATEPVVAGSAQIVAPQIVEDVPGTLTYTISGTAQTRAAIGGDAERGQLAKDLAHQSDEDARAILARIPGVSSASIVYATGPFPQRMPWLSSHITVKVADGR